MKKLFFGSLMLVLIGAVSAPASAEAGIFRRWFARRAPAAVQVSPAAEQAQAPQSYRRYSIEPSQSTEPSGTYGNDGRKTDPWETSQRDPRRFRG